MIDPRGYILTNSHVVDPCPEDWPRPPLRVELEGGRKVVPTLVDQDRLTDLAVLKIDGTDLKPLVLEPDLVDVGEDVVAVGFPALLDGEPSATRGIISARGRNAGLLGDLIQTDAAITTIPLHSESSSSEGVQVSSPAWRSDQLWTGSSRVDS